VMSLSVCLSVLLYASKHNSETLHPNFTDFSVHVACGRVSVLVWRRCNMLCISGFWMTYYFPIMGPMAQATQRRVSSSN